ncbi:MAG: ATP-binding cassette domain-containing protein, partial [Maribacter sp.]|nr:ATP-binding cassette domain-containing protein [Maribacter sp.]
MNFDMLKNEEILNKADSNMGDEPVIDIRDLRKSFGDNHVLNGFSLRLDKGENLVVMGKSGSGKSVMIKCLVGLMLPDSGYISVMGKEIKTLDRKTLD